YGWATITVNSLADSGEAGVCTLRDAITAPNTKTAVNGCVAGNGHDTIQFSVTRTITLAETLPQITNSLLSINGPASPGITIDGGDKVQVMEVGSGATLNLKNVTISNGIGGPPLGQGGGIFNHGTLNLNNVTVSNNNFFPLIQEGAGIFNDG